MQRSVSSNRDKLYRRLSQSKNGPATVTSGDHFTTYERIALTPDWCSLWGSSGRQR
jgi:hypothetical protein